MPSFRVLVTDEVDPQGVELLRSHPSLIVDERPTRPWRDLLGEIGEYDAIVGRSATQIPGELLRAATKLRVIGRAGVGTDNIDLATATELGIAVINAPAGNTIAVAELFFGVMVSLVRHLPDAFASMRAGRWDRTKLLGTELRGRTLGIVGLGRIGGEVSSRARAFGLRVIACDPYLPRDRFELLRVERVTTLEELLEQADIITVHTPLTEETRGMIGERELARLRAGAVVVNMARGGIVNEDALRAALESGHVRAAALDVYSKEPLAAEHPLRTMPNVILTPHLGASTAEGQRNVAVDACIAVRDALLSGALAGAVNLVDVDRERWKEMRGALQLARHSAAIGRAMLAEWGAPTIAQVTVHVGAQFAGAESLLVASAAEGTLAPITNGDRVNVINARARAAERGIAIATLPADPAADPFSIRVTMNADGRALTVGGVAVPGAPPRLTRIGEFKVDVTPRRTLIVLTNADVPGVIGNVGTVLGNAGINIAEYHQARLRVGGEALAAISVDGVVTEPVRRALLGVHDVRTATVVDCGDGESDSWS